MQPTTTLSFSGCGRKSMTFSQRVQEPAVGEENEGRALLCATAALSQPTKKQGGELHQSMRRCHYKKEGLSSQPHRRPTAAAPRPERGRASDANGGCRCENTAVCMSDSSQCTARNAECMAQRRARRALRPHRRRCRRRCSGVSCTQREKAGRSREAKKNTNRKVAQREETTDQSIESSKRRRASLQTLPICLLPICVMADFPAILFFFFVHGGIIHKSYPSSTTSHQASFF